MGTVVLSLFDGVSAAQVALQRLGVDVETYYASEIDKHAIYVTQKNFPNTVQLGDVTNWREWNIDFSQINLILAGFPCQSWSVSGNQKGDNDERGKLFWTMLDIIKEVRKHNPTVEFLIENVKMKKEFEEYITKYLSEAVGEVHKMLINSALVSAQSRNRYYWTSWKVGVQPEDKDILLKDILETDGLRKSSLAVLKIDSKFYEQPSNKTEGCIRVGGISMQEPPPKSFSQGQRVYSIGGKSVTLSAQGGGQGAKTGLYKIDLPDGDYYIRKLTPIECERLQTFPDNFSEGISNTQRYKCLGNSWTVDVIVHILKHLIKR